MKSAKVKSFIFTMVLCVLPLSVITSTLLNENPYSQDIYRVSIVLLTCAAMCYKYHQKDSHAAHVKS